MSWSSNICQSRPQNSATTRCRSSQTAQRLTGLSRQALEYGMCQMRIATRAKHSKDYSEDEWDQLDEFVAIDAFERIGNFKKVMTYQDMKGFLKTWSLTSDWEGAFKRVHYVTGQIIEVSGGMSL